MPIIIEDPQTKLLIEWIPDESEVVSDDHFPDTCRRIAECGITVAEFEQAFIGVGSAYVPNPGSVIIRPFFELKRRVNETKRHTH